MRKMHEKSEEKDVDVACRVLLTHVAVSFEHGLGDRVLVHDGYPGDGARTRDGFHILEDHSEVAGYVGDEVLGDVVEADGHLGGGGWMGG